MTATPTSQTPVNTQLNQRFTVGDTRGCVGEPFATMREGRGIGCVSAAPSRAVESGLVSTQLAKGNSARCITGASRLRLLAVLHDTDIMRGSAWLSRMPHPGTNVSAESRLQIG
jgi:hypothetical protein